MQQVVSAGDPAGDTVMTIQDPAERLHELRAIALCALAIDGTGLPVWKYFGELKGLSVPGMRIEWLEARIAIAVAARIRPAATVRAVAELRDLREKAGQADRFRRFEKLFQRSLGTLRLTNHGYHAASFADLDHAPVWETVGRHITALTDKGYPVFLNSGTLLGIVRDQRLIDHDDDIDLAVVMNAGSMEEAAAEWRALTEEVRALGLLDEDAFDDPAIIKLLRIGHVQVDLFPAWIEGDAVHIYPHTKGELNRADVLPLKPCEITGNPIPADPEKMLAVNYGAGWRTPDPYFKFPWGAARKAFAPFLRALQ